MERLIGRLLKWRRAGTVRLTSTLVGGPATMRVASPSFSDGAAMSRELSAWGGNHFPTLNWTGIPGNAQELVIVIEDVDAPLRSPFVHGIFTGLSPAVSGVTETSLETNAVTGFNSYGKRAYRGPRALRGHGVHRYVFQIFALDIGLPKAPLRKKQLVRLMRDHILARGELTGTYES